MNRCETCKFWTRETLGRIGKDKSDSNDDPGQCTRYPPVFVALPKDDEDETDRCCHSFVFWQQPITQWDTTCGEWQQRESEEKDAKPCSPPQS